MLQTHIRASARIIEAEAEGVSVVERNHDCPVAEEFKWLSREILGLPLERESSNGSVNGARPHEEFIERIVSFDDALEIAANGQAWRIGT